MRTIIPSHRNLKENTLNARNLRPRCQIEALNLLDRHDGDFKLVKSRLGISINALRSWFADEKQLRMQYDYRQWRYFGNLKLVLLNHVLEGAVSTMEKFQARDYEHSSPSQLVYQVATLIGQVRHLESPSKRWKRLNKAIKNNPTKYATSPKMSRVLSSFRNLRSRQARPRSQR